MTPPFRVLRSTDYEAMSQAAAGFLSCRLRKKPDSLLILATGGTPERTYSLLAEHCRAEPELSQQVRFLKLDEWGGLSMNDPATCEMALRRTLLRPLGIAPDRFQGWQSNPADIDAECARIHLWLDSHGPADICVLGLGLNGHLGFNEPGDFVQPGPHRAELSEESKRHAMLSQARGEPGYGLTLGLRDIMQSRDILLLVSGVSKQSQMRRLLTPEITPRFPASLLWLHPAVTLCCDDQALP